MLQSHATSSAAQPVPRQPVRKVNGLMQGTPLMISSLIQHADLYHGGREIVSRLPELGPAGPSHRTTYRQVHARAKRLANALTKELGVAQGTVVATLAFNTVRHVEAYFGVSGCGAILHTVNPRLFLEQLDYIINHAEDHVLLVDAGCVPVLLQLLDRKVIKCKNFVILTDAARMPQDPRLKNGGPSGIRVWCYEELLARHSDQYDWPVFDENTASSLCYTSGTTGNPKGVLYSHRSTVLHSLAICGKDVLAVASSDSILAIVPLFHANGQEQASAPAMLAPSSRH
jgi:fatty-acyl-CoA synthase